MSRPTHSTAQIRRALERSREITELRRQDAEALAQLKEQNMSKPKTKQTAHGPVTRPPDVSAGDALLDEWQGFIDSALAVADKVAARERALSKTTSDSRRFPGVQ